MDSAGLFWKHHVEEKTSFSCQDFSSGTLEELLETYAERIDRDLQTTGQPKHGPGEWDSLDCWCGPPFICLHIHGGSFKEPFRACRGLKTTFKADVAEGTRHRRHNRESLKVCERGLVSAVAIGTGRPHSNLTLLEGEKTGMWRERLRGSREDEKDSEKCSM
ncbi:hypothetical protein ROHU_021380 [Labeo rohita]|uniref:Uncharacterized protein n=1 Tax=Labeo rohita TaxID=84645 RepID=A0A498N1V5_LABRO|nr:hypothetical protein ROHU_021380 [Labeo rohita]